MRGAALSVLVSGVFAGNASPVGKVLQLLDELKGKVGKTLFDYELRGKVRR
jgi:hypothetical protein